MQYQNTPLHEASVSGHTEAMSVLLAAGADMEVKNVSFKFYI